MKKFVSFSTISIITIYNLYFHRGGLIPRLSSAGFGNIYHHWPIVKPSIKERDEEVR